MTTYLLVFVSEFDLQLQVAHPPNALLVCGLYLWLYVKLFNLLAHLVNLAEKTTDTGTEKDIVVNTVVEAVVEAKCRSDIFFSGGTSFR